MKNRHWISNMSIYDLLCLLNEENVNHCVISYSTGVKDVSRCRKYNQCDRLNLCECENRSVYGEVVCNFKCSFFKPDCKQCIRLWLNEDKGVKPNGNENP